MPTFTRLMTTDTSRSIITIPKDPTFESKYPMVED